MHFKNLQSIRELLYNLNLFPMRTKHRSFQYFQVLSAIHCFFFQAPLKCKIEFQGFQGLWVVENLKSVVSQPGSHL